ncbi:ATP-binding response regulator [Thioclava kandeliae]|uniref:histidine kinase n=1 Tax=Thioclava kandeliae TaxID=3070818 RepID=A0ABV1SBW3_9RHOB
MKRMFQAQDRNVADAQILPSVSVAWALLAACLALAMLVLVGGYVFESAALRQLAPTWPAMVPQTAWGLVTLTLAQAFWLRGEGQWNRRLRLLFLFGALGMAVIGIQDQMYPLPDPDTTPLSINPLRLAPTGRMAPATISGVFLMVVILGLQGVRGRWARYLHAALASAGILLCLVAMVAYLFDAPALAKVTYLSDMAFHTATGFLLLYMAALCASPEGSWLPDLLADSMGGQMARLVLPLAVIGPILLCYLALSTTEHGLISPNLRLSALAICLLFLAAVTALRGARYQNIAARRSVLEEKRLRDVLDGLDKAVFVIDLQGRLRMMNLAAEAMAGESPEAFLHEGRFHSIDNRQPLLGASHPFRRLLNSPTTRELHCGWIDAEGREHALKITATLTRKGQGFAEALRILAIEDQTESWIFRENISRTERLDAIGQMAGGVAHEMANILGAARLSVDTILLETEGLSETQRAKVLAVRSVCERGTDLTERLLNLTRDRASEKEAIELTAKLVTIVDLARQAIPSAVLLRLDMSPTPVYIRCIPTDLESAILNLVLNASHAIMEGSGHGEITLRCQTMPGGKVAIAVVDNGPGMSQALLRHVREPFYTTRESLGGTGLGLPMVENFARQADGSFELSSIEGKGTVATLSFETVTDVQTSAPQTALRLPDLSGLLFMVVEDDPHFHDILAQSLQVLGAEVISARSAAEALGKCTTGLEKAPDILISDIILPGGVDGYRLATKCRHQWPELKVLYMSGYTDQLSRSGRLVQGLLLRKPLALDGLVNAIELTLSNPPGVMLAPATEATGSPA